MLKNLRAFAKSAFVATAIDGSLPKPNGPEVSALDARLAA